MLVTEMPDFAVLKLAREKISIVDLGKMMDWDLAQLIAADLVSFNPRLVDRFKCLRASLVKALERLDVCAGRDLAGQYVCVNMGKFVEGLMEQLERDELVASTTRTRLDMLGQVF